jgi:[acyl-carrier-protein] S-malonyltransferase
VKLAFLFPGQGARNVLGGVTLARTWPEGAALLELALEQVKLTFSELEANAGRALERTEVLQPVLAASCLAIHRALLRAGITPALVLGHSLGELPVCAAKGLFTDEAVVKLAALRGALMAREAAKHSGGLLALPSMELAHSVIAQGRGIQLAAVNAPDEVVVAGSIESLGAITIGRRVPVSGAWHSDAMAGAVEEFRVAVRGASPPSPTLSPSGEREVSELADQLTQPVQFMNALRTAQGLRTFVTVGPGTVLRGLVRKNLGKEVRVFTTEDLADFERTVHALQLEVRG